MKINNVKYVIEVSGEELSALMAALRMAARNHGHISLGSNPFLSIHGEFVRQTGFCAGDHKQLKEEVG